MSARLRLAAAAVVAVAGVLMPVPSAADAGGTADGATPAAAQCAPGYVYDSGSRGCQRRETTPAAVSCPARIGGHAVRVSGSGCVSVSAHSTLPAYVCDTARGWALVGDPPYCQRSVSREVITRHTVIDMLPYEQTSTVRVAVVVTEHVRYEARKRVAPFTERVRVAPFKKTYMGMEVYTYTVRVRYCAWWAVVLGASVCARYRYRYEKRSGVRETLHVEPAYNYEDRPVFNYRTEMVCCKPVTRVEHRDEVRKETVCCRRVTRVVTTTRTVRDTFTAVPDAVCTAAGYALGSSSRCERPAGARLGKAAYRCATGWAAVSGDASTCERTLTRTPTWACADGRTIDRATTPPHCHPDPDNDDTDNDDDTDDTADDTADDDDTDDDTADDEDTDDDDTDDDTADDEDTDDEDTDEGERCSEALGSLGSGTVTRGGAWAAGCKSSQKHTDQVPYWAYSYTFTVAAAATVDIDAASAGDPHTYVIDSNGTVAGSDDDSGPDGRDSRIRGLSLTAGAYTIEVTTGAERATGTFTLTLTAAFAEPPVIITGLADHTGYGATGATVTASREFTVEPATAACTATTAAAGAKPKVTAGSAADKRMVSSAAAAPFSHRVTVRCDATGRSPAQAEATLTAKVAVSSVTIAAGRACAASSGTADYACTVPPDGTLQVTATARGAHQGLSLSWSATGGATVATPAQGAAAPLAGARWSRTSTAALSCTAVGTVTVTATAAAVAKTATIDTNCAALPTGPPVRIIGLADATATATGTGKTTVASGFVVLPRTAACTTAPDTATVEPEQGFQRVVSARLDAPRSLEVTLGCGASGYADSTRAVTLTAQLPCSEHLGTLAAARTVRSGTITADAACVSAKRSPGIHYARRYTFTLGAPGWVTIDLAKTTTSSLDPYVLLLNGHSSDGSGTALASDDNSGTGTDSRIARRFLQPGPYTIETTTRHPHSTRLPASTTGDYTLTVTADHTPRVPQHPARLTAQVGRTLRASWGHEPDNAAVRLWRPHPIRPGLDAAVSVGYLDGEHVSGAIRVKLEATATIPGKHTLSFVYDNGGHTATKHTTITAECATGQVTLPLGCVTPVAKKQKERYAYLRPWPSGHEDADECTRDGDTDGPWLYTCRRVRESRQYVSKSDTRILATSSQSALYGATLLIDVDGQTEPEQFEGCQSLSDQYWQCDYHGDRLWYRTAEAATFSNYYWPALVSGVVNPTVCAAELIALRYGGLVRAQAIAGAIESCRGLLAPAPPNTLEDD